MPGKEAVREAVRRGAQVVQAAGGCTPGVACLRRRWEARHGNHLQGVQNEELEGVIDEDLLAYLRHVSRERAATPSITGPERVSEQHLTFQQQRIRRKRGNRLGRMLDKAEFA